MLILPNPVSLAWNDTDAARALPEARPDGVVKVRAS
jgi:hypothetical protein